MQMVLDKMKKQERQPEHEHEPQQEHEHEREHQHPTLPVRKRQTPHQRQVLAFPCDCLLAIAGTSTRSVSSSHLRQPHLCHRPTGSGRLAVRTLGNLPDLAPSLRRSGQAQPSGVAVTPTSALILKPGAAIQRRSGSVSHANVMEIV